MRTTRIMRVSDDFEKELNRIQNQCKTKNGLTKVDITKRLAQDIRLKRIRI